VRLNVPWWGSHDNQSRGRRSKASANTAIPPIRRGCVCTLSANPSIAPQCPALSSTALADSSHAFPLLPPMFGHTRCQLAPRAIAESWRPIRFGRQAFTRPDDATSHSVFRILNAHARAVCRLTIPLANGSPSIRRARVGFHSKRTRRGGVVGGENCRPSSSRPTDPLSRRLSGKFWVALAPKIWGGLWLKKFGG
jgi:hypothetical protein